VMKLQPYSETGSKSATHDVKPAPASTTVGTGHTAAATPKSGGYKIETGDTLASIAKKHYGSSGPKTIQLIVTANHGLDPAKLKVGQEIALPTVKQN
jgi:LysM repeat protein